MSELYNTIYSTPDVFEQEIKHIDTLSDQDRSIVAAALGEAWRSFEAEFGDTDGFRVASAKVRTRFRLELLQTIEDLDGCDYRREVRGVKLLMLYLRGISHAQGERKHRMHAALRNLIRADLHLREPIAGQHGGLQIPQNTDAARH